MSTALSPVDETAVRELLAVFEQAQLESMRRFAALVADGDPRDAAWAVRKQTEIRLEIARLRLTLTSTTAAMRILLESAMAEAAADAARAAQGALSSSGTSTTVAGITGKRAIQDLIDQTMGRFNRMHLLAIRTAETTLQKAVAAAVSQALTGVMTRRDAAQMILNRAFENGLAGEVRKRADDLTRRDSMASVIERETRTVMQRARINAYTGRLRANGQDLVIVSDSPGECETCRPFEGQVLSLSGDDRKHRSVRYAESRGLFHPNCTHSLRIYLKGVTRPMTDTENPQGYADRQRLRALERRARKWDTREALAIDSETKVRARAYRKAAIGDIRNHVRTTSAKRQPHRERAGTSH